MLCWELPPEKVPLDPELGCWFKKSDLTAEGFLDLYEVVLYLPWIPITGKLLVLNCC